MGVADVKSLFMEKSLIYIIEKRFLLVGLLKKYAKMTLSCGIFVSTMLQNAAA